MCKITTAFQNTHSKMKTNTRLWMYTPNGTVWCPFCLVKSSISWFRAEIVCYISRAAERIGGGQGKYKEWGPAKWIVWEGNGSTPPGNFEILHALKCVLGAPEAPSHACTQYIYLCKLLSSISGFRSKSTMYGAPASGLHSSHVR